MFRSKEDLQLLIDNKRFEVLHRIIPHLDEKSLVNLVEISRDKSNEYKIAGYTHEVIHQYSFKFQ